MKKWLMVGGGLLLLAWGPFLYAELTSDPAERKGRDLPTDQGGDDPAATAVEIEEGQAAAGNAAEATAALEKAGPAEPAAEPEQAAPEEPADPKAAPAPPGAAEPDPATAAADEPAEGDEGEEEEDEPAPPPAIAGPIAVLKQAFDNQPRDALWARDAEARITSLFGSDEVPREMLKGAACRRAVCKVEVAWSQEHATAYLSLEQAAREAFGSELGVEPLVAAEDSEHQQVNLYLSRKGYTLADLSR